MKISISPIKRSDPQDPISSEINSMPIAASEDGKEHEEKFSPYCRKGPIFVKIILGFFTFALPRPEAPWSMDSTSAGRFAKFLDFSGGVVYAPHGYSGGRTARKGAIEMAKD